MCMPICPMEKLYSALIPCVDLFYPPLTGVSRSIQRGEHISIQGGLWAVWLEKYRSRAHFWVEGVSWHFNEECFVWTVQYVLIVWCSVAHWLRRPRPPLHTYSNVTELWIARKLNCIISSKTPRTHSCWLHIFFCAHSDDTLHNLDCYCVILIRILKHLKPAKVCPNYCLVHLLSVLLPTARIQIWRQSWFKSQAKWKFSYMSETLQSWTQLKN